jgi:acetoacetate decarboxylase
MNADEVLTSAYSMPLTSPAYPKGPYRFYDREFLIITYRTEASALRRVVPEPLQVDEPIVKYEFIRMPNSTGFGDYTETGQVIPVSFNGERGGYSHAMYLNDGPPASSGDSPRSMLSHPCGSKRTLLSVRSTMVRSASPPAPWGSSTVHSSTARCSPR